MLYNGIKLTMDQYYKLSELLYTDQKEMVHPIAYGKVFIRTLTIEKVGQYHKGHRHNYDHITNLIRGAILCEVDDCESQVYSAVSQITIAADKWHKFTALEDDVIYQCIYHQPDRDDLYTTSNSPYGYAPFTKEELLERFAKIDSPCNGCETKCK